MSYHGSQVFKESYVLSWQSNIQGILCPIMAVKYSRNLMSHYGSQVFKESDVPLWQSNIQGI